jgi:small nuclear ribonucleoprotein (snRNP)-like protein
LAQGYFEKEEIIRLSRRLYLRCTDIDRLMTDKKKDEDSFDKYMNMSLTENLIQY